MAVDLSDIIQQIETEAARVRDEVAELVLASCKADCPVGQDSPTRREPPGGLRDSLRIENVTDEAPTFGFDIVSDRSYAEFTDEVDTSPHLILPVNASVLRFWWESGPHGADIYHYGFTRHPGTQGQRWFMSQNQQRFDDALEQVS